jgi:predicted ATPase
VEYQTARELGEQLLELPQRANDASRLLAAHAALGTVLCHSGAFAEARTYLQPRITLTDPEEQRRLAIRYGVAPGVQCLAYVAWTLWSLGYPDQARQRSYEASTLAQELAHPPSLALALFYVARAHMQRREATSAQEQAEALIDQATEQGLPHWVALSMIMRGWALASQGQGEEGVAQMQQGLKDALTRGIESVRSTALGALSEACRTLGQVDDGLRLLDEALTFADESGQRHSEAELYRLKGELLLQQTIPGVSKTETCFQQALDIARRQEAKSWELRAATSLARLWQSQDKRQDAYDLLAPVYGWFTEGFDTADLQEAKSLLEELSS